ncbi:MAG: DUF4115 domain-containing protein, partial [Casimicrobiaceae bacterium]
AVLYEMMRQQWHPLALTKSAQPAASAPAGTAAEPAQPEGRVLSNPVAPGDAADAASPGVSAASLPDAALAQAAPAATPQSTAPTPQSDAAASKPQVGALQLPPAARTLSDATSGNAGAASAAPKAALQVIFRGTSWIDVKDAQGASVLTMTGNEGATRTVDASPPLDVVVGNADHVDVIFRGQHVDLAAHAKLNVARLQLR